MTPIDRFERELPASLAELGEMRAPDYLTDVLGRTARTRQRPAWASLERWLPMPASLSPRLAVAAVIALLLAALAGSLLLLGGGSPPNPLPSPIAEASPPAATPAGSGLARLEGRWMGSPRALPALEPRVGTTILFSPDGLTLSPANNNGEVVLSADVVEAGDDTVRLSGGAGDCRPTDTGTYRWRLNESGRALEIASVDADGCAARSEAIDGTWLRMGCLDPGNNCLGDLDAGDHVSQFFMPFQANDLAGQPYHYGEVGFTVPDGWSMTGDWPSELSLEPSDWYAANRGSTGGQSHGIYSFARPVAVVPAATCRHSVDERVGGRADDLAAFVANHPALEAGAPEPLTVDGLHAIAIDARLASDWTDACPGDQRRSTLPFIEQGASGWSWSVLEGEEHRYVFVDLDEDSTVMMDIASTEGDFDTLADAGMRIIRSFRFEQP